MPAQHISGDGAQQLQDRPRRTANHRRQQYCPVQVRVIISQPYLGTGHGSFWGCFILRTKGIRAESAPLIPKVPQDGWSSHYNHPFHLKMLGGWGCMEVWEEKRQSPHCSLDKPHLWESTCWALKPWLSRHEQGWETVTGEGGIPQELRLVSHKAEPDGLWPVVPISSTLPQQALSFWQSQCLHHKRWSAQTPGEQDRQPFTPPPSSEGNNILWQPKGHWTPLCFYTHTQGPWNTLDH